MVFSAEQGHSLVPKTEFNVGPEQAELVEVGRIDGQGVKQAQPHGGEELIRGVPNPRSGPHIDETQRAGNLELFAQLADADVHRPAQFGQGRNGLTQGFAVQTLTMLRQILE